MAGSFPVMSDASLTANVAVFLGELVRRSASDIVHRNPVPIEQVSAPWPFSRAAVADYLRIVELWSEYRRGAATDSEPRPCPACRSAEHHFEFHSYDHHPYHECHQCGTWFVPRAIDERLIEAFFTAVPEARQLSEAMMKGRDARTHDSDRARFARYFDMLDPVTTRRPAPLRYLDIGSGVGHSVELAAERGWQAHGVEQNDVAIATGRAKGRNVVRPGELDRSARYDVVSLFETLEHVIDPDLVMADVAQVLAPGGVVMITVPNRASFEISLLRGRCFHVFGGSENVGHINLFDVRGIDALLQRHGMAVAFADGQYSSNLAQIFAMLTAAQSSSGQLAASDRIRFEIPLVAYGVLNAIGPAFSALERALKRSPILIAVACRISERVQLASALAGLDDNWRVEMRETLAAGERTLKDHESTLQTMLADLQSEIVRRDMLLAGLQQAANTLQQQLAAAQEEINLRDRLLLDAQHKLDDTVDEKVRRALRAVRRKARR